MASPDLGEARGGAWSRGPTLSPKYLFFNASNTDKKKNLNII